MNNPLLLDADSPVLLFIVLTVFATTILQVRYKHSVCNKGNR